MLPEVSTLKLKRQKLGWSQRQLAELTGITQGAIAKIEGGKVDPAYSTVKRLFDALDVEKRQEKEAKDIMSRKIVFVSPKDSIEVAIKRMVNLGFSQIPVVSKNHVIGRISEKLLVHLDTKDHSKPCDEVMDSPLITVGLHTKFSLLKEVLKLEEAVVVVDKGVLVGIITKNDLLK
ncbi:MAG: CBS domain-containing protein [Candidatus Altiarchaeota archaeon]|nr:CBS domain-containing protein [Candidatus Altiarchaeota archaeon]